uniref:Uncharacterized protein n=1 Tax=Vespula pensylvanica TaxID=30213 RepID=A0A834KCA6_VESPE|nr:hypothetical protein H0235_015560 [Vespula pensylvanica]
MTHFWHQSPENQSSFTTIANIKESIIACRMLLYDDDYNQETEFCLATYCVEQVSNNMAYMHQKKYKNRFMNDNTSLMRVLDILDQDRKLDCFFYASICRADDSYMSFNLNSTKHQEQKEVQNKTAEVKSTQMRHALRLGCQYIMGADNRFSQTDYLYHHNHNPSRC